MIAQAIFEPPAGFDSDRLATIDAQQSLTWAQLRELATEYQDSFRDLARQRVGLQVQPTGRCVAAMAALAKLDAHVFLCGPTIEPDVLAKQFGWAAVVRPSGPKALDDRFVPGEDNASAESAQITIFTSGTEGTPKAVTHTSDSLARPVRRNAGPQRWLLTYRLELYAGLQVMLQALLNQGTLLMATDEVQPADVARQMLRYNIQYGSATPSYWRRLLMFADRATLEMLDLRQITLGGEIADQQILDALQKTFPSARIVHIYATSELGRCFSVTDGQAGFPAAYLDGSDTSGEFGNRLAAKLRIEQQQLMVQSPNRMQRYEGDAADDDWFATGDLVEVVGDRVFFAGRNGDMINVGGNKVRPVNVERIIRGVPGVGDVRAYGKSSSIAGQIVGCEIVPEPNEDEEELRQRVQQACQQQLASHELPRLITIVDHIVTTDAGKIRRTE